MHKKLKNAERARQYFTDTFNRKRGSGVSSLEILDDMIAKGIFENPVGDNWKENYGKTVTYLNTIRKAINDVRDKNKLMLIGSRTEGYYLAGSIDEWEEWCNEGITQGNKLIAKNKKRFRDRGRNIDGNEHKGGLY